MTEPGITEAEGDFERRPSAVALPALQETEKRFFELVLGGNVSEVRSFLERHPDFNVNVDNFQGVTALHLAVKERNAPMVEFLLGKDAEVGDTALHAVKENEPRIVAMILDQLERTTPGLQHVGVTHSSEFPDDTTPLMVAAQYGHYELIAMLLERGHSIDKPHPPHCYCEEVCKPLLATEDLLTIDRMRLAKYKAVANPAYICQTSEDPILVAFQLAVELKKAASCARDFYHAYKSLSDEVSQFATELMNCARTAKEVELVLKQSAGLGFSTKFAYPRLLFAMECKQKTFVGHPNVQQLMESKWIGDWYEWKLMSLMAKIRTVLSRIFLLPVIAVFMLVAPKSARSKHWQLPVNKFLSYIASYMVFLFFVFLVSNIDKTNQLRGPPQSGFEIILVIYVIAYIWTAFRLCTIQGPRRYLRTPWNWYEVVMLHFFLVTFIFWAASMVDVRWNGQHDLERKYWHKYDPTLIAEGLYCAATIMAFLKLLFFCQLSYDLGPLQVSLGEMINDVTKFSIIFSIVILGFTAGLSKFYQYYDGMVQIDDESKIKTQQVSSFVSFPLTLKTLFWAIFCMSAIESADVVIENLPGDRETETVINSHTFTEVMGHIFFAGFEFISVIVVLNMLIACMANTFTKVTDNVTSEWTFGRTEVYIEFMAQTILPPPFNLLPTAGGIHKIVEYVKIILSPPFDKRARWDIKHCCYIEDLAENETEDFPMVMAQLVQRYFRNKETVEDSDVEQLRKELLELRSLLRDALAPT